MHSLPVALTLLLAAAVVVYLACEYFVNGVEWLGHRLQVGEQATGSILAAIGTALPESVITFIAVVFGKGAEQKALGVGAALGGPLVLATIAYGVVGLTLLLTRQRLAINGSLREQFARLSRDQGWFMAIFVVKIGLGLLVFSWKPWLGALFLLAYAGYFWVEMKGGDASGEPDLEPLKFAPRRAEPATWQAATQTLAALLVIFLASRLFVDQLDVLGPELGIAPQLLALFLSPIATELPETLNAIIWVRQGKHRLALANISGAMMIQATVPTALGLFFTPWQLDRSLVIGAGVTLAAVLTLFLAFRYGRVGPRLLASMTAFYGLFLLLLALA